LSKGTTMKDAQFHIRRYKRAIMFLCKRPPESHSHSAGMIPYHAVTSFARPVPVIFGYAPGESLVFDAKQSSPAMMSL